jgi:hypothetical protein
MVVPYSKERVLLLQIKPSPSVVQKALATESLSQSKFANIILDPIPLIHQKGILNRCCKNFYIPSYYQYLLHY